MAQGSIKDSLCLLFSFTQLVCSQLCHVATHYRLVCSPLWRLWSNHLITDLEVYEVLHSASTFKHFGIHV